jgi:nucleoside-diphosphate-sugar epimerase
MSGECLLLTGSTGLIGGDLLSLLATRGGSSDRIVVLLRPGTPAPFATNPKVSVVSGDLGLPQLGLSPESWRELQRDLTGVLHCGAVTRFSVSREEAQAVNVGGTQQLLDLARGAPQLRRFGVVSTAFVAGRRTGAIDERQLEHQAGFVNAYEWSKYEAERLVRASDVPWSIYRLSAVVGNSTTGRVRQYSGIHQAMRIYATQFLPSIPGRADTPVDFIPDDFASAATHRLFEQFEPGSTYHLCSGPERTLQLARVLEIVRDVSNRARAESGRPPVDLPQLVDEEAFGELRRAAGERCIGRARAVDAMGSFLPQLLYPKQFERVQADRALAASHIEAPPMDAYLGRVVDHCVAHRWGKAAC